MLSMIESVEHCYPLWLKLELVNTLGVTLTFLA